MSFLKKIGSAVKKGVKQVSLKNAVKVASVGTSFIPGVGGLVSKGISMAQDAHYASKEAKELAAQGRIAEAQAMEQHALNLANQSGVSAGSIVNKTLLSSALDGASGQIGVKVAENTFKTFVKNNSKKLLIGLGVIVALVTTIVIVRKRRNGAKKSR